MELAWYSISKWKQIYVRAAMHAAYVNIKNLGRKATREETTLEA
jgi:hypothetical protein